MGDKEKSLGFSLYVDKEMHNLFHIFIHMYTKMDEMAEEQGDEPRALVRSRKTFEQFLNAVVGPMHKLGWCEDPECTWKEGEKIIY